MTQNQKPYSNVNSSTSDHGSTANRSKASTNPIQVIAFDLDDTLLDTSGLLAPQASQQSFQILIDAGLKLNLNQCETLRQKYVQTMSHKEAFEKLAQEFGTQQTLLTVERACQAFYQPDLPDRLELLPGAFENLKYLCPKYSLYLVTAGHQYTQESKVRALNIGYFFKKIFVIDSLNKEKKITAFKKIIELEQCPHDSLLCIGNSLLSEINDACELGAQSCYFEFGEIRGLPSTDPLKKPTFHIKNHFELTKACSL